MPASLETAIAEFRNSTKKNPFTTWFIYDYPKDIASAIAKGGNSVLTNQIVTPEEFATKIVKTVRKDQVILDADSQFIKFMEIASRSPLKKGDIPLPMGLISDIRTVYTFTGYYSITIPPISEKHKIIGNIIAEYRKWCLENNYLDSHTVIQEAAAILTKKEFQADMLFFPAVSPDKPELEEFYESLKTYPHTAFQTKENEKTKAEIICLHYNTAKSEISATIDKIAELLENGISSKDILVLSPSLKETEKAFREYASDFYVTIDGTPREFLYSCTSTGPSLAEIPIISSVLSVLSAVTNDYGIRDMENILSSGYFPNRGAKRLTPGNLHLIADLAGGHSGKAFFEKLESRLEQEDKLKRYQYVRYGITDFMKKLEELEKPGTTYEEIANTLIAWLGKIGWMNAEADELNTEARGKFIGLLGKLKKSPIHAESCTITGFSALIQRLTEEGYVGKYAENGIKIANLRDSSLKNADYVFIVGMTAESVPKVLETLSPFTESETEEMIPTLKEDMYFREKNHMEKAKLLAQKELIISYPERKKRKAFSPSGFLSNEGELQHIDAPVLTHSISRNQIQAGKELRNGGIITGSSVGLTDGFEVHRRAVIFQNKAPSYYDFTQKPEFLNAGYHKVTSPTTIETYLSCPLKWFYAKHMGLYTPFKETESTRMGTAIHDTFEAFFKKFDGPVTEENREEARELLFLLAEEEIDKPNIQSPTWNAERQKYLGLKCMQSPFDQFLEEEIGLVQDGWTTDENSVEVEIEETLNYDGKEISIVGRIDRILKRENEYMVLDYKTGKYFEYDPETKVQIPLYAEACRKDENVPVDGIYLKIVPNGEKLVDPIHVTAGEEGAVIQMEDVIDMTLERCADAMDGMQKGQCCPPEQCPDVYCNFKSICREYTRNEEEEGE